MTTRMNDGYYPRNMQHSVHYPDWRTYRVWWKETPTSSPKFTELFAPNAVAAKRAVESDGFSVHNVREQNLCYGCYWLTSRGVCYA